jgi:hypothetical protein
MDLLLDRELVITPERLERIHQAVLFYADRISLRATSEVPADDPTIISRLRELHEIGAVRTWAHEYEVDDGGRVRGAGWKSLLDAPADLVLPLSTMKELVRQVDDDLEITHGMTRPEPGSAALREGVAEVVQFRRSVIGLRLADELVTDGLLTGRGRLAVLTAGIANPAGRQDQPGPPVSPPAGQYGTVVRTIVERCTFDRLSDLPLTAITDCRRHMPAFRRFMERKISAATQEDPARLAHEIVEEYQGKSSQIL